MSAKKKTCMKEQRRIYRETNREKIRDRARRFREENREWLREYDRQYRARKKAEEGKAAASKSRPAGPKAGKRHA